jgi:predicted metalloprotease with PDZ domain
MMSKQTIRWIRAVVRRPLGVGVALTSVAMPLVLGLRSTSSEVPQAGDPAASGGTPAVAPQAVAAAFKYEIDLSRRDDDLFHVTVELPQLGAGDTLYRFVAFAPGVHQILDYGRLVHEINVVDEQGRRIPTRRVSTNAWRLSDPTSASQITYTIEDSFDANMGDHVIYPMSGTGIEPEYAVLNLFGILGYFNDHRSAPSRLRLRYPPSWKVGTALARDSEGWYTAESYYRLVDSPILMGELTSSNRRIGDIDVEAYVYSPNDSLNADVVLGLAEDVLASAYRFIGFAPVDRYVFLMYFNDDNIVARNTAFVAGGALEHSYSSTYALPARTDFLPRVAGGMAHEFMHILSPLHLRSRIIAEFDYSRPSSEDQHLWLYEGVTDWASGIMRLRGGLLSLEDYLAELSAKMEDSETFQNDWSLTRLSTDWWTDEGRARYGDIYQKGALTAACLDLLLLHRSNGTRGLREVYLDLIDKYGRDAPFDNARFFDELVAMTYPEVGQFIDRHIIGNQPLDYQHYLGLVGVRHLPSRPSTNPAPLFGLQFIVGGDGRLTIAGFTPNNVDVGLHTGDIVLELMGAELFASNTDSVFALRNSMRAGDPYDILVLRDGRELAFRGRLVERLDYHVLEVDQNASETQRRLRDVWMRNLAR